MWRRSCVPSRLQGGYSHGSAASIASWPGSWLIAATLAGLFGAAAACVTTVLYAPDSGLALTPDPWTYSWELEHDPASIMLRTNHLLFHAVAYLLYVVAECIGVGQPGVVAIRTLSFGSLGLACWLLFIIAGRRLLPALGCSLAIACSWGSVFSTLSGETVLVGAVAAMFVLFEVLRADFRPARFATILVLAMLVRQDNVLLVPAIAFAALLRARETRRRLWEISYGLALAGIATIIVYVIVWLVASQTYDVATQRWVPRGAVLDKGLIGYILGVGIVPWSPGGGLTLEHLGQHAASLGRCVFGDAHASVAWLMAVAGIAWIVLLLSASGTARSGNRYGRVALVVVMTAIATRSVFFAWFEAHNHEWHVVTVAFACVVSAASWRDWQPRRGRGAAAVATIAILVSLPPLLNTTRLAALSDRSPSGVLQVACGHGGKSAIYVTGRYDHLLRLRARGYDARLCATDRQVFEQLHGIWASGRSGIIVDEPAMSAVARVATRAGAAQELARLVRLLRHRGRTVAAAFPSTAGRYRVADYRSLTIQYARPDGTILRLDATSGAPGETRIDATDHITAWRLRTSAGHDVELSAHTDLRGATFAVSWKHFPSLPPGWRVDFVEQRFRIAESAPNREGQRVVLPRVYGPTIHDLEPGTSTRELYPTFLQTQQMTLEDVGRRDCLTVWCDDDRGRKKTMGFEVTPDGVEFVVRYIPDLRLSGADASTWRAPYRVRIRRSLRGLADAIDWYRREQLKRPDSFLSRRVRATPRIHPAIERSRFAVAVYAIYSDHRTAGGRYDLSPKYRDDALEAFCDLHGDDLLLFHLGWTDGADGERDVLPDACARIKNGHAALLDSAAKRHAVHSVAYTWPSRADAESVHFDADSCRVNKDGSLFAPWRNETANYRMWCFATAGFQRTWRHYWQTVAGHGFDGIYLDGVAPGQFCYAHDRHGHGVDGNGQLAGLHALLGFVRQHPGCRLATPMTFSETPVDCLHTDASGLDHYHWDRRVTNIFALTYSGSEWPTFRKVFGWNYEQNRVDGLAYARDLANALVGGARPLVLWPELRGLIPTDPRTAPELREFVHLLAEYSRNWDGFWRGIMSARRLESLSSRDFRCPQVVAPPQSGERDPIAFPVVAHGLFEHAPGQRCLVLYCWTDSALASRNGHGPRDPGRVDDAVATVRLSAHNLSARPGQQVRLLDVSTGQITSVGCLPAVGSRAVEVRVPFRARGAKALLIGP